MIINTTVTFNTLPVWEIKKILREALIKHEKGYVKYHGPFSSVGLCTQASAGIPL